MGPPFENGGGLRGRLLPRIASSPLQWGRRSKTAEGTQNPICKYRGLPASMGPPFENGGGPPPMSADSPAPAKLQWGRRSKTAEGAPRV